MYKTLIPRTLHGTAVRVFTVVALVVGPRHSCQRENRFRR